jgi:NAD(P)-dependent dehydrogenase (short-subunit alcohol dehydrogenase family)
MKMSSDSSLSGKTDRPRLKDKVVLLTGATGRLGLEIAAACADAGANLLLTARSSERLEALRKDLRGRHGCASAVEVVAADLGSPEGPSEIVAAAQAWFADAHALINNAATQGPIGPVLDAGPLDWQNTMRVNLLAPVELCRLCARWMTERGSAGSIVNVAGGGAATSRPGFSAYAASKAALVRFSETAAEELAPHGIRVNCIAPGAMKSAMTEETVRAGPERAGPAEHRRALDILQLGGESPVHAAELAVFLASDASDGITGRLISAVWDPWRNLRDHVEQLRTTDIYTLRRIVPADRGKDWR